MIGGAEGASWQRWLLRRVAALDPPGLEAAISMSPSSYSPWPQYDPQCQGTLNNPTGAPEAAQLYRYRLGPPFLCYKFATRWPLANGLLLPLVMFAHVSTGTGWRRRAYNASAAGSGWLRAASIACSTSSRTATTTPCRHQALIDVSSYADDVEVPCAGSNAANTRAVGGRQA